MQGAPTKESSIYFKGPLGQLEALVSEENTLEKTDLIGVICHPHPLHQGTLNNKVVTTIARSWQELGLITVRFNFRGVGKSEGIYGHGLGEVEDLGSVLKELQIINPFAQFWLSGFSFGSFISFQIAQQQIFPVKALLTIAPPIHHFDFSTQTFPLCPWVILQGELDNLIDFKKIQSWFETIKDQKPDVELLSFPKADHFFHGHLVELKNAIHRTMEPLLKKF